MGTTRVPKTTYYCHICGKPKELLACIGRRSKHVFCNQDCYGIYRGTDPKFRGHYYGGNNHPRIFYTCKHCGKKFSRKHGKGAYHSILYCSKECKYAEQYYTYSCIICGKEKKIYRFFLKQKGRFVGKYCSNECRYKGFSKRMWGKDGNK